MGDGRLPLDTNLVENATTLPDFEALLPRNLDRARLQALRQDPSRG